MTDQEARKELERMVKEVYPLIASDYIDKETMLYAAEEITYECDEWRGVHFPYRRLHEDFMRLLSMQYLTKNYYNLFYEIGEAEVIGFLNRYYRWYQNEYPELSKALRNNPFDLSEQDKLDFENFKNNKPVPCKEPLDIKGYLHMCRIAYDAAPIYAYPDFISDLHVVGHAKFDSCRLAEKDHSRKMEVGDTFPEFMHYHPEEMGFGGPYVSFEWNEEGWIMNFTGSNRDYDHKKNKDIHRFLAMRRAGYPVVYCISKP